MAKPRFLQIHFLTSYSSVLLNRDDSGLAKRIPYGGKLRTRISSQCLKRHWRTAQDPHALHMIDGADMSWRSREIVDRKVFKDLRDTVDSEVLNDLQKVFNEVVYGKKGANKLTRQTLLLGEVEINWLKKEAKDLVDKITEKKTIMQKLAEEWNEDNMAHFKEVMQKLVEEWNEDNMAHFKESMQVLAEKWSEDDKANLQEVMQILAGKRSKDDKENLKKIMQILTGKWSEDNKENLKKIMQKLIIQILVGKWREEGKENFKAMRSEAILPGGLIGALFGRMMTSDPKANITAPVHVAHAFTIHEEETESDYFVAVDDLAKEEESGTDTIQETELTTGLFYGYVVVDIRGLLSNLSKDQKLARQVLHNLIYLIAEVTPGAKLGSTAPYSRASMMLIEAGNRQPRSLAEAFRKPCTPEIDQAVTALADHLMALDTAYNTDEERMVMSLSSVEIPRAEAGSLDALAKWAGSLPEQV